MPTPSMSWRVVEPRPFSERTVRPLVLAVKSSVNTPSVASIVSPATALSMASWKLAW